MRSLYISQSAYAQLRGLRQFLNHTPETQAQVASMKGDMQAHEEGFIRDPGDDCFSLQDEVSSLTSDAVTNVSLADCLALIERAMGF